MQANAASLQKTIALIRVALYAAALGSIENTSWWVVSSSLSAAVFFSGITSSQLKYWPGIHCEQDIALRQICQMEAATGRCELSSATAIRGFGHWSQQQAETPTSIPKGQLLCPLYQKGWITNETTRGPIEFPDN